MMLQAEPSVILLIPVLKALLFVFLASVKPNNM